MKPILFSIPMVQAILAGDKTQTRRVVKPQPVLDSDGMWHWKDCQWMDGGIGFPVSGVADHGPHQPGDILWVRETHFRYRDTFYYKADGRQLELQKLGIKFRWRSSIHMPRVAARIFLRVTDVRVERVRDISINDCAAEGIPEVHGMRSELKNWYEELWDSINAKRGYGWDKNPWVWVYEFERITKEEAEV